MVDLLIVTGAGRGIGRSIALHFGRLGVRVMCVSKSDTCHSVAREIMREGGEAQSICLDLTNYKAAHSAVVDCLNANPGKRLAVVGAAGILGPQGPLVSTDLSDWEETFLTNVLGNLAVVKAALPFMIGEKFGRIVMFAGGGSAYANPLFPAYSASKTAIVRVVENLGEDCGAYGDICSVCIAPGAVDTDMLKALQAAGGKIKTFAKVDETLSFLASYFNNDMALLNGRFLHVRDTWADTLTGKSNLASEDQWKLRRIE